MLRANVPILKSCLIHTRTATVVRSEDDSGLDTLWLLKKMAFLSKGGKNKTKEIIHKLFSYGPQGGSNAQRVEASITNTSLN